MLIVKGTEMGDLSGLSWWAPTVIPESLKGGEHFLAQRTTEMAAQKKKIGAGDHKPVSWGNPILNIKMYV